MDGMCGLQVIGVYEAVFREDEPDEQWIFVVIVTYIV